MDGTDFTVTYRPIEAETQETPQNNQINGVTTVTPFEDGTIGKITIPALNNRVAWVRPGLEFSMLNNYVGHFDYSSQWDGNIALASHNRGRGSFFCGHLDAANR
jgi:sortase A